MHDTSYNIQALVLAPRTPAYGCRLRAMATVPEAWVDLRPHTERRLTFTLL